MPIKNLIQETSDYSIFKPMEHNRTVRLQHVMHIMASFKARPGLRPARPVLLNEKYEVVDGQHRVKASERMQLPVFFMIVPGLTIADARLLNALQRTWSLTDYAESYAGSHFAAYEMYLELREEYKIPPATMLIYMTANQSGRVSAQFKVGVFEPDEQDVILARLDTLRSFDKYAPSFWKDAAFALAAYNMMSTPDYDHKRMLKKLDRAIITRKASRVEYLRMFEDIYNMDVPIRSRLRLL